MQSTDLNLLPVRDALLQEGSVAGAARRLHLSAPAVSRSLARLRSALDDPLFVRAGRNLVPTARALALRERTHDVLTDAYDILAPSAVMPDEQIEQRLDRTFHIRTGPDNAVVFGPALFEEVRGRAPRARVQLREDTDDAMSALRDGRVDLSLGSPVAAGTETVYRERLLRDRVVVVGRADGAFARACAQRPPEVADLADNPHVVRIPESMWHAAVDHRLRELGRTRTVAASAPGFSAAFALARRADLICMAPQRLTHALLGSELVSWSSPIPLPPLVIEQSWHHRSDTDPEHRWLRERVRRAVVAALRPGPNA